MKISGFQFQLSGFLFLLCGFCSSALMSSAETNSVPLAIDLRVAVTLPLTDTNAFYTLWRTDDLTAADGWQKTGFHNIRPAFATTNVFFEAPDMPMRRFYKLTKETREVEEVASFRLVVSAPQMDTILAGGPPPLPPAPDPAPVTP